MAFDDDSQDVQPNVPDFDHDSKEPDLQPPHQLNAMHHLEHIVSEPLQPDDISKSCELQVSSVAAQVCTGLQSVYSFFSQLHRSSQTCAAGCN